MKHLVFVLAAVLITSCSNAPEEIVDNSNPVEKKNSNQYSYQVYLIQEVGWCYKVFKGSDVIIDQQVIPSVPGILGFSTRDKAEIAVKFIMEQVEAGNEKPPVTPEELDSIGAINLDDYIITPPRPTIEPKEYSVNPDPYVY